MPFPDCFLTNTKQNLWLHQKVHPKSEFVCPESGRKCWPASWPKKITRAGSLTSSFCLGKLLRQQFYASEHVGKKKKCCVFPACLCGKNMRISMMTSVDVQSFIYRCGVFSITQDECRQPIWNGAMTESISTLIYFALEGSVHIFSIYIYIHLCVCMDIQYKQNNCV